MSDDPPPTGPDPEAITSYLLATYPETDLVAIPGGSFFSLDPERHFPNYVRLITADDDYDRFSQLDREGVFRINLGSLSKETFERYVPPGAAEPVYTAFDTVLPHPVYAAQRYLSVVNPSHATWRDVLIPLIAEAHDRLAAPRARQHPTRDVDDDTDR